MLASEIQFLRSDRAALEAELKNLGAKIRGSSVKCPFHEDTSASGSIYKHKDVWRFKCHGPTCGVSGDVFDLQSQATGKSRDEILGYNENTKPVAKAPSPRVYQDLDRLQAGLPGKVQARYTYSNPETKQSDLVVVRWVRDDTGKKSFMQLHPTDAGYVAQAPPKPWPLYNRTRMQSAPSVVVVEGEKCVHALADLEIVATTNPCGSGKAAYADWSLLAGKEVYLWPDNDAAGISHMQEVCRILETMEPMVTLRWIDPESLTLPDKGDVVDYLALLEDGEDGKAAIDDVLNRSQHLTPFAGFSSHLARIMDGQYRSVSWPWERLTKLSKALLPGTATLLCGTPGSAKTFFLLQAMTYWLETDVKFAAYMLEEDRNYHLFRALAQRVGNAMLTDCDWVRDNPNAVAQVCNEKDFIDRLGKRIYEPSAKVVTFSEVLAWIEDKAKSGCRIIAVDPLTIASYSTNASWNEDNTFVAKAKAISTEYGCSLVLVMHPKKNRKGGMGMDDLAGGASYQRFSQTIIWIETHYPRKQVKVKESCGTTQERVNRSLKLLKTRNGCGAGCSLAYEFSPETLCFNEYGVITEG